MIPKSTPKVQVESIPQAKVNSSPPKVDIETTPPSPKQTPTDEKTLSLPTVEQDTLTPMETDPYTSKPKTPQVPSDSEESSSSSDSSSEEDDGNIRTESNAVLSDKEEGEDG